MESNNNIIEINSLTKKYRKKIALDDISIQIPKGKIVGLLGPNGSGKTTLMKVLSGVICNYQGEVFINKKEIGVETKKIVSYLPDKPYFAKWMRPVDVIKIFKDFYKDFKEDKMMSMLDSLGVDTKQKIVTMSKGMIERLQLSLVMSRDALLYVLDEPLGGVDPATRDYILDTIIKNYNPEGTVLISTHLIEDVEKVFDSVIFIKQGKIVLFEEVDEIREKYNKSVDELFREEFKCF
ncbi:MAG: ABC transporter ATP-binding protein [Oscillospiraceae bacterium]|nr:ABC transporter ATP-binding protein [Oscillospiraceae bacterium]